MRKIAKLVIGLSVLTMLMVCMTAVSFADAAKVNVTVGSSSIIKENAFDFTTRKLAVSGDASETYGIEDTKTESVVTFADVLCTMCAEKFGDAFNKNTAADYLVVGDGGWMTKWFGVATDKVGYAFNRDFNMSGSAYDVIADGTIIDILEMSNFSSPLTYFDQDEVTTGINKPVTLQLSGSSYGMKDAIIKPAEGKTVKAALVDEKGELEDIKDVVLDKDGKITVSFDKAGIYYVSAYGEAMSKDWGGNDQVARIGLPLAKIIVKYDGPVASITVPFKSSSIIKENEFDYADTALEVTGDMSDKYGFEDTKDPSVVTFADVMIAAHEEKFGTKFVPLDAHNYMEYNSNGWFTKWFGVTTDKVGYAFNRDFSMSGSAFDVIADRTYIDVVEMSNFSSPLTYFDKDKVSTTVGKDVTLQLFGSSYGMKGEVIKPALGGKLQVATVNKDGSLTDVEGAIINDEGKTTLYFKAAGTYIVSAYGSGISKDYMGESVVARIGLPLTVVYVKDVTPAKPVIKSAKRTTKTKAKVTWKKAKNAKKYEVAYRAKGAKKWTTKKTAKLNITLKLKAKKAYQVKVRSINGSAKSAYSKTKTIKVKK